MGEKKVFCVIQGDDVLRFIGKQALKDAGFEKADETFTEEAYNANGCYVHIVNGKVVLGLTESQKKRQEYQEEIDQIDGSLRELDKKYLTPRILASAAVNEDEYAVEQIEEHDKLAEPLRTERKRWKALIDKL